MYTLKPSSSLLIRDSPSLWAHSDEKSISPYTEMGEIKSRRSKYPVLSAGMEMPLAPNCAPVPHLYMSWGPA